MTEPPRREDKTSRKETISLRTSAHAAYLLARKLTDNDSERNFLDTRIAETSLPEC